MSELCAQLPKVNDADTLDSLLSMVSDYTTAGYVWPCPAVPKDQRAIIKEAVERQRRLVPPEYRAACLVYSEFDNGCITLLPGPFIRH